MNWFAILRMCLSLVIPAAKAVNTIATEAHDGKTRRQMTVDAITQAAGVADAVLSPADQSKADAVSSLVASATDTVFGIHEAGGGILKQAGASVAAVLPAGALAAAVATGNAPASAAAGV